MDKAAVDSARARSHSRARTHSAGGPWAYLRAATTDPGTVTRKTASKGDELPPADDKERMWKKKRRYCHHCECIKPPRAHHCSVCKRCVDKMGACAGKPLRVVGWARAGR